VAGVILKNAAFLYIILTFDGRRLFRAISKYSSVDEFAEVIYGFTDTLHVFRKITGRKGKNGCSIEGLVNSQNINTCGAHNAILAKLLRKFKITNQMLLVNAKLFS
jgi:hypothetical protein